MRKESVKRGRDDLRREYNLARLKAGVRGKYYKQATAGTNLVLLDPDVTRAPCVEIDRSSWPKRGTQTVASGSSSRTAARTMLTEAARSPSRAWQCPDRSAGGHEMRDTVESDTARQVQYAFRRPRFPVIYCRG